MKKLNSKITENLETLKASLEELKSAEVCIEIEVEDEGADTDEQDDSVSKEDLDSVLSQIKYIWDELSYLSRRISEHQIGHIPAITSSQQLTKALKVLGLDKEYQVEPKRIYASDGALLSEYAVIKPLPKA